MRFDEERITSWIYAAQSLTVNIVNGEHLADAFSIILEKICVESWCGACHDTSVAMYVIFSELGFSPSLCIGEVAGPISHFDHSWVELNGLICDAAVCFPDVGIAFVSAPIFLSKDLSTLRETELDFGVHISGLDEPAKTILSQSLDEYSVHVKEMREGDCSDLWRTVAYIGSFIGLYLDEAKTREKYGKVKRILRSKK
jgi:hypothetical protein